MRHLIKSYTIVIASTWIALTCLSTTTFLLASCQGCANGTASKKIAQENKSEIDILPQSGYNEIILFCGNPGVGKSALCNSVFEEVKFKSGLSSTGLTKIRQGYVFDNNLYIDTPGLADERRHKEAAQEIEAALKKDGNYKIIFVIGLVSGRLRPEDIETVNTICKSIHTPFEYGLIINMLTDNARKKFEAAENEYLSLFSKRPAVTCKIKKEGYMEDAENMFIKDSETRRELINFINSLKANKIVSESVQLIDLTDYKNKAIEANKKIEQLEQRLKALQEERQTPSNHS